MPVLRGGYKGAGVTGKPHRRQLITLISRKGSGIQELSRG